MKMLIFRILPLILILSFLGLRLPVYAAGDGAEASEESDTEDEESFEFNLHVEFFLQVGVGCDIEGGVLSYKDSFTCHALSSVFS